MHQEDQFTHCWQDFPAHTSCIAFEQATSVIQYNAWSFLPATTFLLVIHDSHQELICTIMQAIGSQKHIIAKLAILFLQLESELQDSSSHPWILHALNLHYMYLFKSHWSNWASLWRIHAYDCTLLLQSWLLGFQEAPLLSRISQEVPAYIGISLWFEISPGGPAPGSTVTGQITSEKYSTFLTAPPPPAQQCLFPDWVFASLLFL